MEKQQSPRRVATIIWGALLAGVLMFLGVALFVRMPGTPGLVEVLLPVAGGLSVVSTAISWLWAVRMKNPARAVGSGAAPPGSEAFALTRLIVACALCEGPALFGTVGLLLTGDAVMLLPFALSFVALLAHFPGDRHWAQLCAGEGAARPPGRNPMIRG
jgi:hypothetical protein